MINFSTLTEALLAAPLRQTFVTEWRDEDDIRTVDFGEFIRLAKTHAGELKAQGVQRGDPIILILPQGIDLMAAFAGAMLLGALPTILAYPNFKVDPRKYASGLVGVSRNLNARIVVVDQAFPAELRNSIVVDQNATVSTFCGSSWEANASAQVIACEPQHAAFIQHSAGTTGLQKGVALSHSAVLTQLDHLATVLDINPQDRIYSWLPLYHDMGLIACFMLPMVFHLPIVMQSPVDWVVQPGSMLRLISEYSCTLSWIPNFALQFLARRVRPEDRKHLDLSSIRALINCSEPVRAESIDEFHAVYGPYGLKPAAVTSSYAMAENVFAVTQSSLQSSPHRVWVKREELWQNNSAVSDSPEAPDAMAFVSSGRLLPGNEVRIVSSEGADLAEGSVGEILIRSDSLFQGYYNRPDLTARAFKDGWYHSGDLGFMLAGELFVIGRKNDLIIVAGKNLYPQDLEQIVCNHPAIHDGRAVAFGLYNADLGTQDVIIVAETENEEELKNAGEIERVLRNAIVAELDISPRAICLKPPRWIVKSTAGKAARSTTREKLLLEHPELVRPTRVGSERPSELPAVRAFEHEYLLDFEKDTVITRTIDGTINFWNRRAEELYGWRKEEAVGRVTHTLLKTQFPKPLEEIDSELVRNGRWEGKLVHTTRNGDHVVVESRWILDLNKDAGAVVEINKAS
jgi:PAS domain S-box-containing protein